MRLRRKKILYSLEGKNESDISPVWQILQVFFYVCCILLGCLICWLFTQVITLTQEHCVLWADLLLTDRSFGIVRGINVSCSVEILHSVLYWNPCDVILMIAVVTITIAAFLLVMFSYCGRGGAGKPAMPDAWRIVWPAIIINTACSYVVMYSAINFTRGIYSFKSNLEKQWKLNFTNFDLREITCLQVGDDAIGDQLSAELYALKEIMYLWVSFWGLNLFWLVMRCLFNIDFQLVRTTVYEYSTSTLVRRPAICYPDDHPNLTLKPKAVKFRTVGPDDVIEQRPRGRKTHPTQRASTSTSYF